MKKLSNFGLAIFLVGFILALATAGASDIASISGKQLAIQYIISIVCMVVASTLIHECEYKK